MRNFKNVVNQILTIIPKTESQLICAIDILIDDTEFSAPESTAPWHKMFNVLQTYIERPKSMWEINVWSIFSEIPVEEIIEQTEGLKLC